MMAMSQLTDSDESSNSTESDGWEEIHETCDQAYQCLICPEILPDSDKFFQHLYSHENWGNFLTDEQLQLRDQYDWIRFVNLVRHKKLTDWRQVLHDHSWTKKSVELLHSTLKDDAVLSIDIESMLEDLGLCTDSNMAPAVTDSTAEVCRLRDENVELRKQIFALRKAMGDLFDQPNSPPECSSNRNAILSEVDPMGDHLDPQFTDLSSCLQFAADPVLLSAYRNFITANSYLHFFDKRVLEFDCGPAILGLFAIEAGASQAFVMNNDSSLASVAQMVISDTKQQDRITLVQVAECFAEQIDSVLIHPTGLFLSERAFDPLAQLLSRYPTTRRPLVFPQRYSMKLLGMASGTKFRSQHVDKWLNLCGHGLTSVHQNALTKVHLLDCSIESQTGSRSLVFLNSTPSTLYSLDIRSVLPQCLDRGPGHSTLSEYGFAFPVDGARSASSPLFLDALVLYFDLQFHDEAPCQVIFTTSPTSPATCWKQAVLFLHTPLRVEQGDRVTGSLTIRYSAHSEQDDPLQVILMINSLHDQPTLTQTYWFATKQQEHEH